MLFAHAFGEWNERLRLRKRNDRSSLRRSASRVCRFPDERLKRVGHLSLPNVQGEPRRLGGVGSGVWFGFSVMTLIREFGLR